MSTGDTSGLLLAGLVAVALMHTDTGDAVAAAWWGDEPNLLFMPLVSSENLIVAAERVVQAAEVASSYISEQLRPVAEATDALQSQIEPEFRPEGSTPDSAVVFLGHTDHAVDDPILVSADDLRQVTSSVPLIAHAQNSGVVEVPTQFAEPTSLLVASLPSVQTADETQLSEMMPFFLAHYTRLATNWGDPIVYVEGTSGTWVFEGFADGSRIRFIGVDDADASWSQYYADHEQAGPSWVDQYPGYPSSLLD